MSHWLHGSVKTCPRCVCRLCHRFNDGRKERRVVPPWHGCVMTSSVTTREIKISRQSARCGARMSDLYGVLSLTRALAPILVFQSSTNCFRPIY